MTISVNANENTQLVLELALELSPSGEYPRSPPFSREVAKT